MNSSYVLLNSLRVHYLAWNRDGAGLTVVCHHGLASNAHIWEMTAPFLAERGHRIYAYDARGHGLTDQPDDGYDHDTLAGDLLAFLEACRIERPLLVGHSWGANVLLAYAARHPYGPLAPTGIVLVDGGMTQLDDQGASWEEMEQRLTPPDLDGMPVDEFTRKLYEWNADWGPSEQAIAIFLNSFDVDADERIHPRLTRARHMRIVRSIWDFKTYDYYGRVRCPVLMAPARSSDAEAAPYLAAKARGIERAQSVIPDLHVCWMDDSIHDLPVQRPGQLAEAIAAFAGKVA